MCRPKHVEQLRNIGIINSTTRLHLIGSLYGICLWCIFLSNGKQKLLLNTNYVMSTSDACFLILMSKPESLSTSMLCNRWEAVVMLYVLQKD